MSLKRTNVKIDTPAGAIRVFRKYFDGKGEDVGLSCCEMCCCSYGKTGCWAMEHDIDCRDYEPAAPDRNFAAFFCYDYEEAWL